MKFVIVAVLVLAMIVGRRLQVQRQVSQPHASVRWRRVPPALLGGSERTWVVFTTPHCAVGGTLKEHIATEDPGARVVTVDATREPHLADAFAVRTTPTVLLADASGEVLARLVGAPAVRAYLARIA